MKIKTSSSIILNQLRVISKLVPPSSGNICIEVKNNNMYLYAMNDTGTYKSIVPCDSVEGNDAFDVAIEAFRAMIANRDSVELSYVNRMLVVTEKGYRAELATTDALEVESFKQQADNENEKSSVWKVSADQGKWIQSACAAVNLKAVEALAPFMPTTIKITDKGAFVCCYDSNHMAFIHSKEVTGNIDVTMPSDTLASVFDAFANSAFKMEVTESQLVIKSKLLTVKMSLPISDSYMEVSELLKVSNQAMKSDSDNVVTSRSRLLNFLDSCKAVATKERSELQAIASGKKLQLMVKTVNGTVKQVLPLNESVNTKFNLDFMYFEEAIRKDSNNEEIIIKVVKDSFIIVGAKNGWCIISLYE